MSEKKFSLDEPETDLEVSELKVLESAAGFYIGTTYTSSHMPWAAPYSRESGYFPTAEEAGQALEEMKGPY